MDWIAPCRQQVTEALARLLTKGLVQPPGAEFSVRIPGQAAMATGAVRVTAAGPARGEISVVAFDAATDPMPVYEAPLLRMHAAVYRHRLDVGAILTSRLPWAFRLASLGGTMPAVFDEQARHLGPRVERLALPGMEMTEGPLAILKRGANAFLFHQGVICLGFTAERAVLNAEVLEKCAQAYILASLTRHPIEAIPSFVRFIAGMRLHRDQKRASKAHARGEVPVRPKAY